MTEWNRSDEDRIMQDFLNSWNKFHETWNKKLSRRNGSPNNKKITVGKFRMLIPTDEINFSATHVNITRPFPIYRALPEPYFIHKEIINNTIDLHAVFININPSEPKFYHLNNKGRVHKDFFENFPNEKTNGDAKSNSFDALDWFEIYNDKIEYSEFISELIDKYESLNGFWFNKRRRKWCRDSGIITCDLKNIASFELYPWHTKESNQLDSSWKNPKIVNSYIIKPAIVLSKRCISPLFRNKIFSRGMRPDWRRYFEANKEYWLPLNRRILVFSDESENKIPKSTKTYLLDVHYNPTQKVFFLNFSGPSGTDLPKIDNSVCLIKHKRGKYISVQFKRFLLNHVLKQYF